VTIIATAVKHLMAAGVTGDALIAAIAEMEAELRPVDPAAEKRRAWDRERKRRQREEVSGGIPVDQVETAEHAENGPSLDKSPQTPKIKPIPAGDIRARKATRLPQDWKPCLVLDLPDALRTIVATWAAGEYDRQAAIFMNHWLSAPGPNASKRDWDRTWHNWLYRAEDGTGTKRVIAAAPPPGGRYERPSGWPVGTRQTGSGAPATPEAVEEHAARLERIGRSDEAAQLRRRERQRSGAITVGAASTEALRSIGNGQAVVT